MIFLFKYRRVLIGAALVTIVIGTGFILRHKSYNAGYSKRVAEEGAAIVRASNLARARIVETERKYDEIIKEIQNTESTNNCVGDHVRHVLDRL
ncbi:MAG: hypothetical protein JKY93_01185 [Gammaproteobacteria bacterium]|nr:hypothetical protein [Gammaproteobacteria bacterium]